MAERKRSNLFDSEAELSEVTLARSLAVKTVVMKRKKAKRLKD